MDSQNIKRAIAYIFSVFAFLCFVFLIKKFLLPPIDGGTKIIDLIPSAEAVIAVLIFTGWISNEIIKFAGKVQKIITGGGPDDEHEKSDILDNAIRIALIFACLITSAGIYIFLKKYAPEEKLFIETASQEGKLKP